MEFIDIAHFSADVQFVLCFIKANLGGARAGLNPKIISSEYPQMPALWYSRRLENHNEGGRIRDSKQSAELAHDM